LKLCSHAFSVFQLSQGSVATLTRWGGWSSYLHTCRSFQNLTVKKTTLKSVIFDKVTDKTKLAPFYGPRCTTEPPYIVSNKNAVELDS